MKLVKVNNVVVSKNPRERRELRAPVERSRERNASRNARVWSDVQLK